MAKRASEIGAPAIAITDHGEVGGHIEFMKACEEYGVQPILGMEGYVVDSIQETREAKLNKNSHLCMWAENNVGLSNLWAISTKAYLEGLYYKPLADWELLKQYSEGIIASDGCMLSNTARYILDDDFDAAKTWISKFLEVFGEENFFIELHTWQFTDPSTEEELQLNRDMTKINQGKVQLAKELGLRTIVVNDAHFSEECHHENHSLVWAMSTNTDQTGGKSKTAAWIMSEDEVYFWMSKHGVGRSDVESAIKNTREIARRCEGVNVESRLHLPSLSGSEEKDLELFNEKCESGFKRKVEPLREGETEDERVRRVQEYRERWEYEHKIITDHHFHGYFLVVADYVDYAKKPDPQAKKGPIKGKEAWLVGPARGSGGGSLVAWLMDITELDPIVYGLIFERFINPDRATGFYELDLEDGHTVKVTSHDLVKTQRGNLLFKNLRDGDEFLGLVDQEAERSRVKIKNRRVIKEMSFPDFDIDFPQSIRHQMKDYLAWKYGEDRVCGIGTFSRLQPRGILQDLGRALEIPYDDVRAISKVIEQAKDIDTANIDVSWDEVLAQSGGELGAWATKYPYLFQKMDEMMGLIRQSSTHAAGVLVSDESLIGSLPLRVKQGEVVSQFEMYTVESLGFIKFDILGIRHLDTLMEVQRMVTAPVVLTLEDGTEREFRWDEELKLSDGRRIRAFELKSGDDLAL